MIKLNVKDYCHNCPELEVGIQHLTNHTVIYCEHWQRCKAIERHIKNSIENPTTESTDIPTTEIPVPEVCSCYDAFQKRCNGTREREACGCEGNTCDCDFYPEKRG